jgi:CarboxypepD_reg-like domain
MPLIRFLLVLFCVLPFGLRAGVVKGTIRDTTGQPIPYVAVLVKNSSYGVNSNLNGAYFLELKPGSYTLVFSQLGLTTLEQPVTVTDSKPVVLNVTMRTSSLTLNTFEITTKGDRDKGKEIMKQVIDNRSTYWDRVNTYQCRTYQKASLEKASNDPASRDSSLAKLKEKSKKQDSTARFQTKRKKNRKKLFKTND